MWCLWSLFCSTFTLPLISFQFLRRTKTVNALSSPWNQKFEFHEIGGGEYLKIKCFSEEILGVDSIGSARVNLEGLVEGSVRDIWVPLEKVNSGELRLQIEAVRGEENEGSRVSFNFHGSECSL